MVIKMETHISSIKPDEMKTAGGIIINVAKKKLNEYKTRQEWRKLFIDTGEFFIKQTERASEMIDAVSALLSKDNMIKLSRSVEDQNGFHLKNELRKELEHLMRQYEIPHDEAVGYVSHFMQVIIADIEANNPEKFEQMFLSEWREEERQTLKLVTQRLEDVNRAVSEIKQRKLEIYSSDQVELNLLLQTENPSISLDFFETDDEMFRTEFEEKMGENCIYVSGRCREELIYSILYELRRQKVERAVLVVKNYEDWEKLRLANQEKPELQGKILIPWFLCEEIIAIPNNTNIFVYGEDEYCVGKNPIRMRKRTKQTVRKKLKQAGVDTDRAYHLVEDTHGLYIPLKKKIIKGSYRKAPGWADGDITLTLPVLLCGKWAEDDGDKIILEQLSGKEYDKFIEELYPYTRGEDPLLVRYRMHGKVYYQLAGLENAWDYLDCKLDVQSKIWENFSQILADILVEPDPEFDFPAKERHIRAISPEGQPFWSKMIKDGMLRSLIMRAYYKKDKESQYSIDYLVESILKQIRNTKQWLSIAPYIPELCEASPQMIQQRLEREWNHPTGLLEVFKEDSGDVMFGSHLYTYVLWGIEQFLAQAKYATWAVRWLIRLAEEDIEYTISNSPEKILKDVFCPWINLTALKVEDKVTLAREMVLRYKKGWDLLYVELPGQKTVVTGNFTSPKYRDITEQSELTNQDIYRTYEEYVLICLSNMEFLYERWNKMIEEADKLGLNLIKKLFKQMEYEIQSMNDEEKIAIKDTIRRQIYQHRYFRDAVWAMEEDILSYFENQLQKIHTDDPIYEYRYLFAYANDFPLLHPMPYDKSENGFKAVMETNKAAAEEEIRCGMKEFKTRGYDASKLVEICALKDNSSLGLYLCKYYSEGDFDSDLFRRMLELQPNGKIAIDYVSSAYVQDTKALKIAIETAKQQQVEMGVLIHLYSREIISTKKDMLISKEKKDIKQEYWKNLYFYERDEETIRWMLKECEKYGTQEIYMEILGCEYQYFSPIEMLENLENMQKMEVGNLNTMSSYYLEELLGILQRHYRKTGECKRVAQIELYYEGLLGWDKMKCFKKMLEIQPTYYAEMAEIIYLKDGEEKRDASVEHQGIVNHIYDLYYKASFCPAENDGTVNEQELEVWVEEFIVLLEKQKQRGLFGHLLGRVLANSPIGADDCYPCEAVRKIIEHYENDFDSLCNSYTTTIFNKRGVYSPSAGKAEMEIANAYQKNADKLRTKYPRTADIYDRLYQQYKYQSDSERECAEYAEY